MVADLDTIALPATAHLGDFMFAIKEEPVPPPPVPMTWTIMRLTGTYNWRSVAYGNNKFVAVIVNQNKGAYSTDGINWTEMTLPVSRLWYSVTYGNNKFVAVANGSNTGAYSTDGINWTAMTLPTGGNWYSVTYGNNKFVAVTYNSNKGAYSTDGINWTEMTLPANRQWFSVTYGNNKFVAAAADTNTDKGAYSTDGINWTEMTLPSSSSWRNVAYGNGKFVAIAYNSNKSAYSTDGINWTEITLPASRQWFSVTYGNDRFIALANATDKGAYSTDGINWTEMTLPISGSWYSATWGNGRFVALVYGSDGGAYSTNDTPPPPPPPPPEKHLTRYHLSSLFPRTWAEDFKIVEGIAVEGLTAVAHDATLTGTGTSDNPLSAVGGSGGITAVVHDTTLTGNGTVGDPLSAIATTHANSGSIAHVLIKYTPHPSEESTVYTLKIVNRDTDDFALILVYINATGTQVSSFTMQQYGVLKPYVEYYRASDFDDALRITLTNNAVYDIVAEAYSNGNKIALTMLKSDAVPTGTGYIVEDHSPAPYTPFSYKTVRTTNLRYVLIKVTPSQLDVFVNVDVAIQLNYGSEYVRGRISVYNPPTDTEAFKYFYAFADKADGKAQWIAACYRAGADIVFVLDSQYPQTSNQWYSIDVRAWQNPSKAGTQDERPVNVTVTTAIPPEYTLPTAWASFLPNYGTTPSLYLRYKDIDGVIPATTYSPLIPATYKTERGITMSDDGKIQVKAGEVYLITLPAFKWTNTATVRRIVSCYNTTGSSNTQNIYDNIPGVTQVFSETFMIIVPADGYMMIRVWNQQEISDLKIQTDSYGMLQVARLSGGGGGTAAMLPVHDATIKGTGTSSDPLVVARPNYESVLRANDIDANDYIELSMTFVKWEPIEIKIIGVNKFELYGRWNGTDVISMTAPAGVEVTSLGGGSIRIRNTSANKWYGNQIKVTYLPSAVTLTRNTPA
jgi:hypothetical protein